MMCQVKKVATRQMFFRWIRRLGRAEDHTLTDISTAGSLVRPPGEAILSSKGP